MLKFEIILVKNTEIHDVFFSKFRQPSKFRKFQWLLKVQTLIVSHGGAIENFVQGNLV